jgi:tryptophan-rich sensory protein
MNTFLLYNIFIPILLAIIVNGIIYTFGIRGMEKSNPFIPPGYIVGSIWVVILGLLGYVHYLLYSIDNKITFASLFTIFVILFCISYPFITGLKEKNASLLNLISLILAFTLGLLVIVQSKYIFIYTVPLIVWTSYVNFAFIK